MLLIKGHIHVIDIVHIHVIDIVHIHVIDKGSYIML